MSNSNSTPRFGEHITNLKIDALTLIIADDLAKKLGQNPEDNDEAAELRSHVRKQWALLCTHFGIDVDALPGDIVKIGNKYTVVFGRAYDVMMLELSVLVREALGLTPQEAA